MVHHYCKDINITDTETIKPWVWDCCMRHKKRHDFRKMFIQFGMSRKEYEQALITHDKEKFTEAINNIAAEAVRRIQCKDLQLPPVRIRIKEDTTTFKLRAIGIEYPIHQIFDYIAVYSSMEIFKHRMVKEQCSSIPGRGQIYGLNMIKRFIMNDNQSREYAEKHNVPYDQKCKYFVKLDLEKCYPSADRDRFLELFKNDCGNEDILWLWQQLLASHSVPLDNISVDDGLITKTGLTRDELILKTLPKIVDGFYGGFIIGALPSQWACQYMISFIYRYAKSLHDKRGNQCVKHMVLFMDDMLLTGSNKSKLKTAVRSIIEYTATELHWKMKCNWDVRSIDEFDIDMMGFVIMSDGSVKIRDRNFIHSRRLAIRFNRSGEINPQFAKRALAYKGFYKYQNTMQVGNDMRIWKLFKAAEHIVSEDDKRRNAWK